MPRTPSRSRPAPIAAPPLVRCGAEMIGVGTALPATVVRNEAIAERLGIDANWILKRTGIEERRSAQPGERLFEFAAAAGADALAEASVEAAEVDLIVVATTSNEELMPAAAPRVAALLGAADAACYDVNSACTGFLSAVSVACGQIESGRAVNVLVIGADLMMPLTDPDDRATSAVFADGAGAVLMRGTLESRVGPIVLRSDGSKADLIRIDRDKLVIEMQGHETFRYAVDLMSSSTVEAVGLAGLELGRRRPLRLPPGQRPDPQRGRRPARDRAGAGDQLDRQARQHLGGVDPAGARPGEVDRAAAPGRAGPARRLRCRGQLGRDRDRVGRDGERRCLMQSRPSPRAARW